ncbi:hypothetical protein [Halopiger djelfimassiliensis]|uniref:hypothetical protein n=1 Tax=Halopiger djelfimassiliensis TaxID=1293047 RepID=UPI000677A5AE|nr:hypothetical protein [Halopiger djelfimassiliensis]
MPSWDGGDVIDYDGNEFAVGEQLEVSTPDAQYAEILRIGHYTRTNADPLTGYGQMKPTWSYDIGVFDEDGEMVRRLDLEENEVLERIEDGEWERRREQSSLDDWGS